MQLMLSRIGSASITLFFSFLLSLAILIGLDIVAPAVLAWMLDGAELVENAIGSTGLNHRYNNWVRLLVSEDQILFLFFTIISRILIAVFLTSLAAGWRSLTGRSKKA